MLVKYGAVMTAYGVLGIPVFGKDKEQYIKNVGSDMSAITRDYIRNSSLLISLAKAIGRIVISYKEVQELAGYTTLVYELKEVLDDLKAGRLSLISRLLLQVHGRGEQEGGEAGCQEPEC